MRFDLAEVYMPPFRVAGNLYFVGTKPASAHLIDTGEGLILLDVGYQQTLYLVLDGIYRLGFRPEDIRLILLTHGHIDHLGGARCLAELTGAKTAIGREDEDSANGRRDLSCARELGMVYDMPFQPDILLEDGDELELGDTRIRCFHTPGHTQGTMSFLFNLRALGGELTAGTHGGIGMNTLRASYLNAHGLPASLREDFRAGLARMREQRVDVFIPNHQDQWDTLGKCARMRAGETDAFVDPSAWARYLDMAEERLDELLRSEAL